MIKKFPLLFIFLLSILGFGLYLVLPVNSTRDILAPRGEGDRLLFGEKIIVGQEFNPHRGITGIDIPLGSVSYPSSPLILHIRNSNSEEDVIVAPLFALQNEMAQFRFSPLWKVPETMVWILEAPHAARNSLWVYREKDESAFQEGDAFQGGRVVKGNIGFNEHWKIPRITTLFSSSETPKYSYFELKSFYIGIIGFLLVILIKRLQLPEKVLVAFSLAIGIALHVWVGMQTPVIIDEGAYIQDVLQASTDLLPFRDFLTKGPAYLLLLWIWSFVVPNTVIAWRLLSAISWAVGGYLIWKISKELGFTERARFLTVLSFNLLPAAVALTTPLLLQTTSIAVSLGGLYLALVAVKKDAWRVAALSAIVFTLAFLMRVTSVIPACVALGVFLFLAKPGWKLRLASTYVVTGLFCISLVFGVTSIIIGFPKASVMVNLEAFLISRNRSDSAAVSSLSEPLIRTLTIESRLFWRAGVLLITTLFLLPLMFVTRHRLFVSSGILLAIFFITKNVLFHLFDTNFLLPKEYLTTIWIILLLGFAVPGITALATLLHGTRKELQMYQIRPTTFLLLVVWLFLTAVAYAKWGRFRQSYLVEFLPQLTLLCGIGFNFMIGAWSRIRPIWFSRLLLSLTVIFVFASFYQGYVMTILYPHTGSVDQKSLARIASLIESNVPESEMIFTAQPVATALANRQIMFGYAHPGWYRDARIGTISQELLSLLFKKPNEITEYLRTTSRFVLMESRTHEIYFDGYPEREEILKTNFNQIGSIQNDEAGDTYILYRRN